MALDKHTLKTLIKHQDKLGKVLTLGRLHIKYPDEYCETLLRNKGATLVDSMDVSTYEHATIKHDLNKNVPKRLHSKYHTIIDGGTLEHVYDFPIAIKNVGKMLKQDGIFISTQLLNYTGHGFYTLSPELLIKAALYNNLVPIEIKVARALGPFKVWYDIPITMMKRIEITSFWPLYMIFVARKDSCFQGIFPEQSSPSVGHGPIKHFLWNTRLWNIGD